MQEADDSYIGAFAVKYLFSLAVPERTGFTTVDGALKQASEIGMPKGQGCKNTLIHIIRWCVVGCIWVGIDFVYRPLIKNINC